MAAFRNNSWILFLSILFLLTGIFCLARVGVNFAMYSTYPVGGVIPILQPSYLPTTVSEASCNTNQLYYDQQGMPTTTPTEAEKAQNEQSQKMCVQNVVDTRNAVMFNDLGVTAFFLFLGLTLLGIRRFVK